MAIAVQERMLVQGDGSSTDGNAEIAQPRLYFVERGQRRAIADSIELADLDIDLQEIQVIPDAELEEIPIAPEPELATGERIVLDLRSFLGAGHYMQTYGVLRKTDWGARIDAKTRTWTITMFGGFRGAVEILFSDAEGFPVGMSPTRSFGVDGTWIGRSDRTDYWSFDLTQDQATRTTDITIFHFWNPSSFQDRIAKLVALAKPILEIIAEIKKMGGDAKSTKT